MTIPSRDQLRDLWSREGGCVSILLPTHRAGKETQQARIRLKNLLREAEERWNEGGQRRDRAESLLRPGHDLLADEGRWRSLEDGLVVYLAPGFATQFTVPATLDETLVVGRRFYLLPLLPLVQNPGAFLILALSVNQVRLFAADRFQAREIDLPGVPRNLNDAVGSDYEQDMVQMHTVRPGSGGVITHGHGVGQDEDAKEEATRFGQRVDAGLRRVLQGQGDGSAPLVIAAAEPLASIYSQVNRYPSLASETVAGNPEILSAEDLRARAWPVIERMQAAETQGELDRCRALLGTGRASTDPREILLAANDGRVEALFVAQGARLWGSFDPEARSIEVDGSSTPRADELLNLAAGFAESAGGAVRLVARESMPENADAAAIFRY